MADNTIDTIDRALSDVRSILVLGRGPSSRAAELDVRSFDAVAVVDPTYALRDVFPGSPRAVMIGDNSRLLNDVARRYLGESLEDQPLLLHAYLPDADGATSVDFAALDLPNAVPILPLLKEAGLYHHQPGQPYPTSGVFLAMVCAALGKQVAVAGVDLYRHPSGVTYVDAAQNAERFTWPKRHSEACDLAHLAVAKRLAGDRLRFIGVAGELVAQLNGE